MYSFTVTTASNSSRGYSWSVAPALGQQEAPFLPFSSLGDMGGGFSYWIGFYCARLRCIHERTGRPVRTRPSALSCTPSLSLHSPTHSRKHARTHTPARTRTYTRKHAYGSWVHKAMTASLVHDAHVHAVYPHALLQRHPVRGPCSGGEAMRGGLARRRCCHTRTTPSREHPGRSLARRGTHAHGGWHHCSASHCEDAT